MEKQIRQTYFEGERPLFGAEHLSIQDTIFGEGESPLKESRDISLEGSIFQWKYPLWYSKNIAVKDGTWAEMARAGVWYTDDMTVERALIEAPKNFRRCRRLTLKEVALPNALETLWHCTDVTLDHVMAKGDYFAMDCENMKIQDFQLAGNYSFDGAKNVEIHNAKLLSKDAFWNSENVTVYDSVISGLQGMCYIENLVMKNCKLVNTTLAFEYSTVDVEIQGGIDSVINPTSGVIRADSIGTLIMEPERVNPADTEIICKEIKETRDHAPK